MNDTLRKFLMNLSTVRGDAFTAVLLSAVLVTATEAQQADDRGAASSMNEAAATHSPPTPGDAIRISVPTDTGNFLNNTYPIDQNGYIFLPLLGSTRVTGGSMQQLTTLLDSVFTPYLRFPSINVELLIRVSFIGGFQRPGLYYVNPHLSLWDALSQTGGPFREDGLKKLRWLRDGKIIDDDLITQLGSGESLRQIGFKSGDRITVTAKPLRTGWEVFREDVLPIISLSVAALASVTSIAILVRED